MNAACTILDADFLHYGLSLNESLMRFNSLPLYILVIDNKIDEKPIRELFTNIHFLYLEDINKKEITQKIISKYHNKDQHALRWALKSVLVSHLLESNEKVLFLDCDLYFFNNYQFLFDELDNNNVILTPHWRNSSPHSPFNNFNFNFTSGLFNAGFIGANRQGAEVMNWWAICCEYRCVINNTIAQYGDQAYLSLMPINFPQVKILQHRGCNVAEWNYIECKRTQMPDGEVLINNQYPIVFIHFTKFLVQDINSGKDILLSYHLKIWEKSVDSYRHLSEPYRLAKQKKVEQEKAFLQKQRRIENRKILNILKSIKQWLRIRTRIKRFIQG